MMNSNMKAKKQFGQNWLIDQTVVRDMVEASQVKPGEIVVEIGPGQGVLTEALLKAGATVIAIEKDRDLIPILEEKFGRPTSKLVILERDVRDIDIADIVGNQPYKVVANIPYYITGLIIRQFLSSDHQPRSMTLLVQREVADRIVAPTVISNHQGKHSVLSLSVAVFGNPHKVRNVKAGAFRPIPKVDSAILQINDISQNWFSDNQISKGQFFKVIKNGFNQKRKTLSASLGITDKYSRSRPEDLNLENWVEIINDNPHL